MAQPEIRAGVEVEPRHIHPPDDRRSCNSGSDARSGQVGPAADLERQARDGVPRQAANPRDLSLGRCASHRTDDPAGLVIDAALPRPEVRVQQLPALPYGEVAECLATVQTSRGANASCELALEFLIVTAARSGEVRKANWGEIDLGRAVRTLPAERMKANREHRVPLSTRAVVVLEEAAGCRTAASWCFLGTRLGGPNTWPREDQSGSVRRSPGVASSTRREHCSNLISGE